jgi:hypothetical protein
MRLREDAVSRQMASSPWNRCHTVYVPLPLLKSSLKSTYYAIIAIGNPVALRVRVTSALFELRRPANAFRAHGLAHDKDR